MMTSNICVEMGLFNGAMGIVKDIYFKPGRQPSITGREHPDIDFVEIPSYCGDEIIPGHPHL
eukprot:2948186-Rhodomonas_salina.1